MVQLIRIVSNNETQTDITNFFNESITINPGSKIALESLKIELSDIITVTTDNNTFTIQVSEKEPNFTVVLTPGIYTTDNFITELKRAMSASMIYTFLPRDPTKEQNFTEWQPIMFNNKLVIQFCTALPDTGRLINWKGGVGILPIEQPLEDGYYLADAYERTLATTDPIKYVSQRTERVGLRGPLEYRFTVNFNKTKNDSNVDAVPSNIVLGLRDSTKTTIKFPATYTIEDLKYALEITRPDIDENNFIIKAYIDGLLYSTEEFVNNPVNNIYQNITLGVTVVNGKIKFQYSDVDVNADDGNWVELGAETSAVTNDYDYNTTYQGYVLMGELNNSIFNVVFTPSPYQNANSSGLSLVKLNSEIQDVENHIKYDQLGQPSQTGTVHTLIFSNEVKKLLGFYLNQYTLTSIANQFLADTSLDLGYYSDEIIVELPTEFVNAFEGSQHRRRNIIRYIPSDLEQLTKVRAHTFQYPLYMDLLNKDKKVMNYFQVRVLDKYFNPLKISGTPGSMTILLIIE